GLDQDRLPYFDAGRIAEDGGCHSIAVHGRTAQQMYSGRGNWARIAELKAALRTPVVGHGDVFSADDALQRMSDAGDGGVAGCRGNPWLFREADAAFRGEPMPARPPQGEGVAVVREHCSLLREHFGEWDRQAILRMRKFGCWYATGFPGATEFRRRFQRIENERDLEELLAAWLGGTFASRDAGTPEASDAPACPGPGGGGDAARTH